MTPALLAAQGEPPAFARTPATEAVHTIEPLPWRTKTGPAYLIAKNGPIRSARGTCHNSSGCSKSGTRPPLMSALA